MGIAVFSTLPLKAEHFGEAGRLLGAQAAKTTAKPDCLAFHAARSNDGSNRLFTFERWASDAAFDAHMADGETQALFAAASEWMTGEPHIVRTIEIEG